ncbi:hypothetical protein K1T71_005904 [Dendrolimus kikuchii]|uniref:Uncharacterized protein n=1 Tax=Dendrolimus kikuchii TaxID=765133 RepID=A0ACC1D2A9_9NEOP|nr:hypothetical protein K1T71_005904 [Dendrolimus kikuchii]
MYIFMIIIAFSLLICFHPMQCSNHQRRSSGPHAAKIDKMIHTYLRKNWNNIQDAYILDYISDNNELAGKIEHMFAQLNRFLNIAGRVHFLWFLILYEKCLAAHVDLTTAVERIFQYQVEYEAVNKKPEHSEETEAP